MKCAIIVGLAVPFLGACQLEPGVNPVVGPEELATAVVQFSDLPVPHEMELLAGVNQSWSWQRDAFRNARLDYRGQVNLEDVRGFLRDRLPGHGWELLQEERPTQERLVQRWLSKVEPGVQYVLDVELRGEGPLTHLRYDLGTRRDVAAEGGGPARPTDAVERH